jgi:hypothetical protein
LFFARAVSADSGWLKLTQGSIALASNEELIQGSQFFSFFFEFIPFLILPFLAAG